MPNRLQMKRTKGWRKPEGVIYVGRLSRWGNPYSVAELGREEAIKRYQPEFPIPDLTPLKGTQHRVPVQNHRSMPLRHPARASQQATEPAQETGRRATTL